MFHDQLLPCKLSFSFFFLSFFATSKPHWIKYLFNSQHDDVPETAQVSVHTYGSLKRKPLELTAFSSPLQFSLDVLKYSFNNHLEF